MSRTPRDELLDAASRADDGVSKTRELPRIACGLTVSEPSPRVSVFTITGTLSHEEFDHYLADLGRRLVLPQNHVVIINIKAAAAPPAWQVERQAAWIADNRFKITKSRISVALVVGPSVDPKAVETMMVLADIPGGHKVCKNLPEALYFAQTRGAGGSGRA